MISLIKLVITQLPDYRGKGHVVLQYELFDRKTDKLINMGFTSNEKNVSLNNVIPNMIHGLLDFNFKELNEHDDSQIKATRHKTKQGRASRLRSAF